MDNAPRTPDDQAPDAQPAGVIVNVLLGVVPWSATPQDIPQEAIMEALREKLNGSVISAYGMNTPLEVLEIRPATPDERAR